MPDFHPNAKYINDTTLWEWKEVDFGGGWKEKVYGLKPQYQDTLHRNDGSVIEVLVNGQVALTKRFYYSGRSPRDLHLQWKGATGSIAGLSVWQLQPISADRLTS